MLFASCSSEDKNTTYDPPTEVDLSHSNDQYLYANSGNSLFETYGTATRWRWNDNFIDASQRAIPVESDLVIPATKIVQYLWIQAYSQSGEDAAEFIKQLFPAELVYIGSYIYKDDGTRLLGYAEGGARVTILNLNSLDYQDEDWLSGVLRTAHHEFSHIVHQNYGIPVGYNTISETYLGNNWSNNVSLDDAIKLGMVRDYATLNEYEDFADTIAHLLVMDPDEFDETFITQQDCSAYTDIDDIVNCQELNAGRLLIAQKVEMIVEFYKNTFNIDLLEVRDILQSRLKLVLESNEIPD